MVHRKVLAGWRGWLPQAPGWRDPRWAFAALLALYAVLGCTVLGFNRSPAQILLTVAACCALDFGLGWLLRGERLFPLSACITGLSLALLLNYAHGYGLLFIPAYLAIGSKYVFTHRGRHVFNPSLFGVAVTLLLAGDLISPAPAYQWGGSLAVSAFIVMAALTLFVFRIGRNWLVVSFLAFYALQTALRAYVMRWHLPAETLFIGTLTSAPFFLFTFYMLTDPRTSPERPRDQVGIAFAIAVVDLWLHTRESLYTFFYAAFFVGCARFLYLHLADLWRTHPRFWARNARRGLRPAVVVGAVGLCGGLVYGAALAPTSASEVLGFRLQAVPASHSGITARLGRTLEQVDPRVQHVAKWILSQGEAVAVGDYDNDGLQDLFVTGPLKAEADRAVLYRNRGDLRFERAPIPCLTNVCAQPERYGLISGALFVDWDNDGDQDLFLNTGFGACRLLRNRLSEEGRPRFEDVTAAAGIESHSVSLAAQFFDYDRDGRLDLYLANALTPYLPDYPHPTPLNLFRLPQPQYPGDRRMFHFMHASWYNATNGGQNRLYRNLGVRFEPLAAQAVGMPETHWSLAVGTGDLNHDGWTDLYVANDFGPDDVYLNRTGHGFTGVRSRWVGGIGRDTYKGMNASLGDVDRDGNLDVYVSNVHHPLQAEGSLLWRTRPGRDPFRPEFIDSAASLGALNERRFGWGAAMGDLNNDGWLDILQANGMVDDTPDRRFERCPDYWYVNEKVMRAGPEIHAYADMWGDLRGRCIYGREANRVYLNRGTAARPQFVDVADRVGWREKSNSRGIAVADLDNDGDLDTAVTHPFAPLSLYRNTLNGPTRSDGAHWIGLKLAGDGKQCSREAVGTKVTLTYREGGRTVTQSREVQLANGFSAQSDRRLLFGLGSATGPVQIHVRWHGSTESTIEALEPGRYHTIRHP